MGIELTEEERWDLVDRNMVAYLGTVGPDGRPQVVPIWYVADRYRERIYFSTPGDTRKARDVARRPEVSLSINEGALYFDLRAVVCYGTAHPVEIDDRRAAVEEEWCEKYFDRPDRPGMMDALYAGRDWEWFYVDPGSWRTWDNRKIDIEDLHGEGQ